MREFTNMVSNDSVSETSARVSGDLEVGPSKASGYHVITVKDIAKFVACCLTVPALVLGEYASAVKNGENLRYIISSKSNPSDLTLADSAMVFSVLSGFGCIGGILVAGFAHLTLAGALVFMAEGAVVGPIVFCNAVGAGVAIKDGIPVAFKAAARHALKNGASGAVNVLISRPCRALKAGASGARERIVGLANREVLAQQPRLQGPK